MNEKIKIVRDELFRALNAPGKFRLKIIKIIFPEMIKVAEVLRNYYWQ